MLRISLFELFAAVIPEVYIFVIGTYILTNEKFQTKRMILIGLLTGMITYFVRLLPIFPGANILFSILIVSTLFIVIGRLEVMKVVPSILLLFVIRLVTEWLNIIFLISVLHLDLNVLADDPIKKTLSFLPSIVLFAYLP